MLEALMWIILGWLGMGFVTYTSTYTPVFLYVFDNLDFDHSKVAYTLSTFIATTVFWPGILLKSLDDLEGFREELLENMQEEIDNE